ncbi:MAG: hemolysin family protein [Nitrososphaera sp.]|uniref:HlyC/CorC-like protein n=1 Tax=Nitrososphaera gargensis (strain Ga9.2) TaxID=1237085 RepID=K0IJ69_NITGG|nr:hemolysin family protein [Candidatus Nitrososphaera gargensis]AFU60050.1 HlyC/CorC-like protein [Candidatus Nitrososphaera gargensis Ga9.2]
MVVELQFAIPALGALVALSAFFSGLEVALVSLERGQLRRLVNEKRSGANSLAKLKSNPKRMLITILLGVNLANIGAAAVATDVAIGTFGSLGLGIATGIMTFILLVFGDITPKAYCYAHAEKISLTFARVILAIQYILYPLVILLELITKGMFRAVKIEEKPKRLSEAEVRAILDIGVEEKVLMKEEREMMKEVLEFHDTAVRAIMTPRNAMFVLSARLLIWDALPLINNSGFSRIPIVDENNKDNVLGIVHTRDVLKVVETKTSYMMLKDIARKPLFVSKDMPISKLLKEFQARHLQIAIVVDEFGSTEGLVTLEDVIEELVGEITDEKDIELQMLRKVDRQTVVLQGDVEIDDVNEALNVNLPKGKDYSTISGLLHEHLQRIPREGDKATIGNVIIAVEEIGKNVPLRITVRKVSEEEDEETRK